VEAGFHAKPLGSGGRVIPLGKATACSVHLAFAWESDVTPEEMEILQALGGTDFQAFFPTGRSIAAAERFDALVESLLPMQQSR
jgi:hypothetical protein